MGTELHQQKFLTLECDGRSRISCTSPTWRRRRAPGYFLNFLTLLPAREGKATENTYYGRPSSYGVCRDKGGEGQLGAGELTWPGGPLGGEGRRGVAGAGGLHAGAMDRAALLGPSRLCALWAAVLALFPCGAQGNWM